MSRNFKLSFFAVLAIASLCGLAIEAPFILFGQTKTQPSQIATNGQTFKIWIIDASGRIDFADIGAGVTLDTSGARPVIKANVPILNRNISTATTSGGLVFNLSPAPADLSSICFYRNGLLMSAGIDYSVTSAGVLTLVPDQAIQKGDVVNISWR